MSSSAPITILRNARVFSPAPLGVCDLVVADGRVSSMGAQLPSLPLGIEHAEVDLEGRSLVPGFIDAHVHLTGGGGESGPGSRVPPLQLSELTRAGVTTCVGVLGTDGTTRTLRDLVASALAMNEHGMTAYCYTGSYEYPVKTLTGSVRDDIVFVGPILGVGELAISDHRSSQPTLDEFLRVASETYTAGLMSGKAGVFHLHMGDGPRQFQLIEQALDQAEIPARVYHPTHVNRQKALFEAAIGLSERGVTVDVTAFPEAENGLLAVEAIDRWLSGGHAPERITCSSDGGGCLPTFDSDGEMVRMGVGQSDVLGDTLAELLRLGHPLEQILPPFTSNVARLLRLSAKGRIAPGMDADFIVLDSSGAFESVMCRGTWAVKEGEIVTRGPFEAPRKEDS